jgi:ferritin-like metal-binding protein YciE
MQNQSTINNINQRTQLKNTFEEKLKEMLWVKNVLTNAIPMMINNTKSSRLSEILSIYLDESFEQIVRLEKVFNLIDKKPESRKCNLMGDLMNEVEHIIKSFELGFMCDARIILAIQKAGNYQVKAYETLSTIASVMSQVN